MTDKDRLSLDDLAEEVAERQGREADAAEADEARQQRVAEKMRQQEELIAREIEQGLRHPDGTPIEDIEEDEEE